MATLTIPNLDDLLEHRLRLRAAARNHSMEEEARQILRAALEAPVTPAQHLGARIRARFAALGDVRLAVDTREAGRPPPPDVDAAPPISAKALCKARSGRR